MAECVLRKQHVVSQESDSQKHPHSPYPCVSINFPWFCNSWDSMESPKHLGCKDMRLPMWKQEDSLVHLWNLPCSVRARGMQLQHRSRLHSSRLTVREILHEWWGRKMNNDNYGLRINWHSKNHCLFLPILSFIQILAGYHQKRKMTC